MIPGLAKVIGPVEAALHDAVQRCSDECYELDQTGASASARASALDAWRCALLCVALYPSRGFARTPWARQAFPTREG